MTATYASDREDAGDSAGTSRQAGSGPRRTPGGRQHRRHKRSRQRLTLLDYPDSEGVTRELVIGDPRRLARRKALLAVTASAVVALGAVFGGRAVLRSSGTGPAPDIRVPLLVPFPSLTASSTSPPRTASNSSPPRTASNSSPPLAVNLRGTQLTPSVAPAQNAAAALSPTPTATSPQQTIAVQYLVVSQWDDGFQGEVHVVNNGSAPIANWQITVALPGDEITSFWGASGYVSNHILLLQPAPDAGPLAAGGELRVFFEAEGTRETPELCAFDNINCG